MKRPIFLVINNQLFLLYNFSKFLYISTLFIHHLTSQISPLIALMMVQQNRNAIVSTFFSINLPFLFGWLVVNFSSQTVQLLSIIYIIIIIMSRRLRGYPWPSLAISPYHSSPPAGLQGYIPCPHIAAVCKFVLVVPLLHIHVWGSTGVHRLWARPCFSSKRERGGGTDWDR